MKIEELCQKLQMHLDCDLELVINENKSTMLSVLGKDRKRTRVSLHRMFLDAPEEVISAVAHYVRGTRRERHTKDLLIRGYIQTNLSRFNYSPLVDKEKLESVGRHYDLTKMYEYLNERYFNNRLQLNICWFGTKRRRRSRMVFGQYFEHLKLIKIHRLLDDPFYPPYFVEFVVYHEMLHDVVPGYIDEKGLFRTHGAEFKAREREFKEYHRATAWEKAHRDHFFKR